jgi:hypothetical protein
VSSSAADSKPRSRTRALAGLLASPRDAWLATRAFSWLCVLPALKRTLPLERLVRLMWLPPRVATRNLEREQRTISVVARLSRSKGGNCLERSLVVYRYLARANADPRLVVGMTRPDEYLGHVWVAVDRKPLLETTETLRGYKEVMRFGNDGERVS